MLSLFNLSEPVILKDGRTEYVNKKTLVQALFANNSARRNNLTKKEVNRLFKRIKEIASPNRGERLSEKSLEILFTKARENSLDQTENSSTLFNAMDQLKQEIETKKIPSIPFKKSLDEASVVNALKPGDFIFRKNHEDNPNIICKCQRLAERFIPFHRKGYREAYKFSHVAVYLGRIPGSDKHWIAEASVPNGYEAQIRKIEIGDERFALAKKNEYFIVRNKNQEEAAAKAEIMDRYTAAMKPEKEEAPRKEGRKKAFKYNFLEAARSLYHTSRLGFFGRHRLLKYYADHLNGVSFEHLGFERKFFCSHLAATGDVLSQLDKSDPFQHWLAKHPIPRPYNENKTGLMLKISKLWYSIRKALWAYKNTFFYYGTIGKSVSTKVDILRVNPAGLARVLLKDKKNFEIVGMIRRESDWS